MFHGELFEEINLGVTTVGSMEATSSAAKSYYFNLDIPEDFDKDTSIIVRLSPIKGKFTFCVSASNSQLIDEKDCTWSDYDNDGLITFGKNDKNFKRSGDYGILIKPTLHKQIKAHQTFAYSLLVISQGEFTPFVIGQPQTFFGLAGNEAYFRTAIDKNSKYFSFTFTTDDPQSLVQLTNDVEDFSRASQSNFSKSAMGKKVGIYYKAEDLKDLCTPNEKAYGRNASMVGAHYPVHDLFQTQDVEAPAVFL